MTKKGLNIRIDRDRAARVAVNGNFGSTCKSETSDRARTGRGFNPNQCLAFNLIIGVIKGALGQLNAIPWDGELAIRITPGQIHLTGLITVYTERDQGIVSALIDQILGSAKFLSKGATGEFEVSFWWTRECELCPPRQ